MYGREQYTEGKAEGNNVGITKGKKEGMIESFPGMVKDGLLSIKGLKCTYHLCAFFCICELI